MSSHDVVNYNPPFTPQEHLLSVGMVLLQKRSEEIADVKLQEIARQTFVQLLSTESESDRSVCNKWFMYRQAAGQFCLLDSPTASDECWNFWLEMLSAVNDEENTLVVPGSWSIPQQDRLPLDAFHCEMGLNIGWFPLVIRLPPRCGDRRAAAQAVHLLFADRRSMDLTHVPVYIRESVGQTGQWTWRVADLGVDIPCAPNDSVGTHMDYIWFHTGLQILFVLSNGYHHSLEKAELFMFALTAHSDREGTSGIKWVLRAQLTVPIRNEECAMFACEDGVYVGGNVYYLFHDPVSGVYSIQRFDNVMPCSNDTDPVPTLFAQEMLQHTNFLCLRFPPETLFGPMEQCCVLPPELLHELEKYPRSNPAASITYLVHWTLDISHVSKITWVVHQVRESLDEYYRTSYWCANISGMCLVKSVDPEPIRGSSLNDIFVAHVPDDQPAKHYYFKQSPCGILLHDETKNEGVDYVISLPSLASTALNSVPTQRWSLLEVCQKHMQVLISPQMRPSAVRVADPMFDYLGPMYYR